MALAEREEGVVIGYKLWASGRLTDDRKIYRRRGWTEGSLGLLKGLVSLPKAGVPGIKKGQKGLVGGVEKGFRKMAEAYFLTVCSLDWDMRLTIMGDFSLTYSFRSDASSDCTACELALEIANQREKMGDQVLLALCSVICEYHVDAVSDQYTGPYSLIVHIDL